MLREPNLVGARGFEPLTSSASRKRSPPELSTRDESGCLAADSYVKVARWSLRTAGDELTPRLGEPRPSRRKRMLPAGDADAQGNPHIPRATRPVGAGDERPMKGH